ncbi:MAG: preprotein translocase subunit SecY [Clostridia bacterium]|nr:preprotein translocase subunit SecY [Clostridia bacterium]
MFKTLANAWKIADLKRKIIFTLVIVLLYRIGASIPVPYVSSDILNTMITMNSTGSIFDYLNVLSGQAFSQATLFALSVSPYITAQIVIQLLTIAIPALERLSKEGEEGKKKINTITRIVTVVLAVVTAYGYYTYIRSLGALTDNGVFAALVIIACYCGGASLIMWLAEKINENGIGNGISIILFVNILAGGYTTAQAIINQIQIGGFLNIFFAILSVIIMLAVITLVVFITNSERRIPVQYAKRVVGRKMYGGQSSNLPLKLNMSGVMPIIFANSIVSLPPTIAMFAQPKSGSFWEKFLSFFAPTSVVYVALFIVLIIAFSYFYISISFNTIEVSNNLKKNGGFIPGIRPGKPTSDYIKMALNRITLIGALFLAFIAGLPLLVNIFAKGYLGALAFGGSSLLIVVGVALETARELESQMAMRHYKGFLE